jgi:perosamine synthetase
MKRYIGEEELIELKKVIDSQKLWKRDGSFVRKFEAAFSEKMGVKYAIGVNSGSSALETCVAACNIKPGDEVICTAYSFIASSMCVLRQNGIPVFADVDPRTLCLDPADVEKKITARTKAIIVVHIYGQPAEMNEIMRIAKKYQLLVIEDCCQAYESWYQGRKVGTIGDMGVFSLQQGKQITSGEGGIVITNNEKLFRKAAMYSNIGMIWDWERPENASHFAIGGNYRMGELQAAVAFAQLGKINIFNEQRKKFVRIIEQELAGLDGISLAYRYEGAEPNFYFYPLRYDENALGMPRDEFIRQCREEAGDNELEINSGTIRINYLEPIYRDINEKTHYAAVCGRQLEYKPGLCPVLEKVIPGGFITIRLHHGRSRNEIKSIVDVIKNTLENL